MSFRKFWIGSVVALTSLGAVTTANAVPITVTVGDDDGYGVGIPDNGATGAFATAGTDNRSAAEAAATNGAQFTDVYSSLFPPFGPNGVDMGSFLFPFAGTLNSGSLTIDMADFQSTTFGSLTADINGVGLPFSFDDGFMASMVRSFLLTPAQLAAANLAGFVSLNLDHSGSSDFIGFDYLELSGDVSPVPLPAALPLMAGGLGLMGLLGRRKKHVTEAAA